MPDASPPEPESPPKPPAAPDVEGFVLHAFIGRGSSGMVWRATQEGTLREVALKLLAPWQAHALAPLRFLREAEITASLEHPAVARVFGAGECPAGPWLAMELIEGPPADAWVRETKPPLRERVVFFSRICTGISHAHQRGVIHRDLKPGNVLVTPDGQPKIVDFGLARRETGSSFEVSLTREGDFLGTLAWMPPEQAAGQWTEVDALSDVFALGAILFGLLSGEPPLDTSLPPAAQLAAAQGGERRLLREVVPGVPRDLEAIIARCLAGDKRHRYQSAAEVEADVARWLAGEPVRAPVSTPLYWIRRKIRRHWPAFAAAATGLAAALTVAGAHLSHKARLAAEIQAATRREAEQKAQALHESQELVAQVLVEVRQMLEKAGHPEWIGSLEKKISALPWDEAVGSAYDSRRFRGRSALVRADLLSSQGQWGGALHAYHQAIDNLKTLVQERPEVPLFREDLVQARLGTCKALLKLGYHKEACTAAGRVIELTDPALGLPPSPTLNSAVVEAATLLCESATGLPARAPDALALARHVRAHLVPDRPPDALHPRPMHEIEWETSLGIWIIRLSARLESQELARAEAGRTETAARQLVDVTTQGTVSKRLLASTLAACAELAVLDGDAAGACRHLDEASKLLQGQPAPLTLTDAPYIAVAQAWEKTGSLIAEKFDPSWAIEAHERSLDVWSQVRKRSPQAVSMMALSRVCLACTRLALQLTDPERSSSYAFQTCEKFRVGRRDGTARAQVALDAIEAALLMLEARIGNKPGQPGWRETIKQAQDWLDQAKPRMISEVRKRRDALTPRIQATCLQ